eukprot:767230-Hanusia_phi.AAC.15
MSNRNTRRKVEPNSPYLPPSLSMPFFFHGTRKGLTLTISTVELHLANIIPPSSLLPPTSSLLPPPSYLLPPTSYLLPPPSSLSSLLPPFPLPGHFSDAFMSRHTPCRLQYLALNVTEIFSVTFNYNSTICNVCNGV